MSNPKSISPSPIIEAVCEIRFQNELPSAVIFGKLYAELAVDMSETEQLPILQMPPELSEKQPGLEYAPHYRLKNDKFVVNIGKKSISVNRVCTETAYESWAEYLPVVKKVYDVFEKAGIVTEIERVSVRYINFFDAKIDEVLELNIDFLGSEISSIENATVTFVKPVDDGVSLAVLASSNAKVEIQNVLKEGLILNLEAFTKSPNLVTEILSSIEKLHLIVEEQFFESLHKTYLETLNPVYE